MYLVFSLTVFMVQSASKFFCSQGTVAAAGKKDRIAMSNLHLWARVFTKTSGYYTDCRKKVINSHYQAYISIHII